jgi:hypothetical protein
MKAAFPVRVDAQFAGKTRNSGGFDTDDGHVAYGEKFLFLFASADGLSQTVEVADKQLLEIGYDTHNAVMFEPVVIVGDVVINTEGRSFFRPLEVTAKQSAKAS